MAHLSHEALHQKLQEARTLVTEGGTYEHYKSPGHFYTITGFAILEATDNVAVIYMNDAAIPFIRPLASFIETVEYEGMSVPRFRAVH